ncbi:hypothetical protein GGR50DRAFT_696031 [Xylaria sp. CBS 124048]|nr:hypothetical protein GGR50DRAFT_696031 [Xylaria sp. CBS 124048]
MTVRLFSPPSFFLPPAAVSVSVTVTVTMAMTMTTAVHISALDTLSDLPMSPPVLLPASLPIVASGSHELLFQPAPSPREQMSFPPPSTAFCPSHQAPINGLLASKGETSHTSCSGGEGKPC